MTSSDDLVELSSTLGRQIQAQSSADRALTVLTGFIADVVTGVSYASVTRVREAGFQTVGATHPDANVSDRAQYELGSGPCLDAVRQDVDLVSVPDVAHDDRYPTFGPVAAAHGVGSMLSVRLVFEDDAPRASLNLYSGRVDGFDDTARTLALLLSSYGAVAVAGVAAREYAASLERALDNSRSIGMAMGILMASRLVGSDEAFTLLRVTSQNRNRKVADIAADVIATGTLDLP